MHREPNQRPTPFSCIEPCKARSTMGAPAACCAVMLPLRPMPCASMSCLLVEPQPCCHKQCTSTTANGITSQAQLALPAFSVAISAAPPPPRHPALKLEYQPLRPPMCAPATFGCSAVMLPLRPMPHASRVCTFSPSFVLTSAVPHPTQRMHQVPCLGLLLAETQIVPVHSPFLSLRSINH